jgi:hypothetical protein
MTVVIGGTWRKTHGSRRRSAERQHKKGEDEKRRKIMPRDQHVMTLILLLVLSVMAQPRLLTNDPNKTSVQSSNSEIDPIDPLELSSSSFVPSALMTSWFQHLPWELLGVTTHLSQIHTRLHWFALQIILCMGSLSWSLEAPLMLAKGCYLNGTGLG